MIRLHARLASLDANDWALLRRAFVTLVRIRLAMWMQPWHRLANSTAKIPVVRERPAPDRVAWAVGVTSRAVPRATCLTQALALHRLLSHHGYSAIVQVGVSNVDKRFTAHAWVEHEGQSLLGTPEDVARYSRFFSWPTSRLEQP